MLQKWRQSLASCRLFQNIPFDELNEILHCLGVMPKEFRKNEFGTLEGDSFSGIGVILSGRVAVTRENASGNRVIMLFLHPGEIFGEIAAFADDDVWPATVLALEDCAILFLPPQKIVGYCRRQCPNHRLLIANMLKMVSNRALYLSKKIEYLSKKSLRSKIAAYLLDESLKHGRNTFMLRMNRNELAEFLNIARPSLSREMSRMRDEGIMDFHKGSIKIKDINALKLEAE